MTLSVNEHVVWTDVGDEVRLYHATEGEFQTLNATAAEIWRRIAGGTPVAEITAELVAQFSTAGSPEARLIERDVREFVDVLLAADLVCEGAGAGAAGTAPPDGAAGHD